MCIQLDAYAVLHLVIQNWRLAGRTNGKDILEKRKISCSSQTSNPRIFQPQEHLVNVRISVLCFVFGSSWLSPRGYKIEILNITWLWLLDQMSRLVKWTGYVQPCDLCSILLSGITFYPWSPHAWGSHPVCCPVDMKNLFCKTLYTKPLPPYTI